MQWNVDKFAIIQNTDLFLYVHNAPFHSPRRKIGEIKCQSG